MSPVFNGAPTDVKAGGFEVFAPGDYEFIVGEPKAFANFNPDGSIRNYGVRYSLTHAESSEYAGKMYFKTLWEHSAAAKPMNKQFLMAASGYPRNKVGESQFNEQFKDADFSFDTDTGTCGDGWRAITGSRVIGTLDVRIGDNDEEQQQEKSWRPVGL